MNFGFILIFTFLTLISSSNIYADGRKFARSYTAYTLSKTELEFEFLFLNKFDKSLGTFSNYKPKLEIEYGILNKLTASFYFNFNETNSANNSFESEPFKMESNSIELRYRFTEEGEELIDPALYFEFEFGKDIIGYEPKLILSRNYKNFTGVLNITSEFERELNTDEKETSFEISGGVVNQFTRLIGVGIEFKHSRIYEDIFGKYFGQATFLGPTINLSTGEINLVVNIMKQISGSPVTKNGLELIRHEKYEISAIVGVEI